MKISIKLLTVSSLVSLFFSTSCVETVIISSVAGGAVAVREKTLKDSGGDVVIGTKLLGEFIENGLKNPGNSIDFTINEGRVLLTGIARDAEKAQLAQLLAWKVSGVKEVIDEIQIHEDGKFYAHDIWVATRDYLITAQVETRLTFTRDIISMNYKTTAVGGVVYILGVAQNEFEMRRVVTVASKVRGVSKVVNHVILQNDSRRN